MGSTRLIFVSGKGGTGKSAFTAATAIDYARRGHKVLAIDMEGRAGLAAHLRTRDLAYDPVQVRPGLHAMVMNRPDALDEYLKAQLHVPQGAPTRHISAALAVLADTAPGVREIISIGKPIGETLSGTWDVVLVDAPSLGQFQSYLRAPQTIAELVPTGTMQRLAGRMRTTLRNEAMTSVHLVTTPSDLPVLETQEAIDTIASEELSSPPRVFLNRVLPTSTIMPEDLDRIAEGPARDAATLQLDLEQEQERWRNQLSHTVELPYLLGVFTPGEVAEQLADMIGSSR